MKRCTNSIQKLFSKLLLGLRGEVENISLKNELVHTYL